MKGRKWVWRKEKGVIGDMPSMKGRKWGCNPLKGVEAIPIHPKRCKAFPRPLKGRIIKFKNKHSTLIIIHLQINIQTISSHGSSHGSPSKPFHHTLTAAFLRHRPRSSPASICTSSSPRLHASVPFQMPVEIDQKSIESNEIDSPYLSSCYRFIFKAVEKSECCLIASIHLQDRKMQYRGHFGLLDSPDKIKQLWGYYAAVDHFISHLSRAVLEFFLAKNGDSVPIPAVGGISVTSGILKVEYDDNKNDKTSYDVK
ncbi:hypothetical protein LXL04_020261 [Taraxacum kok-saghyz]